MGRCARSFAIFQLSITREVHPRESEMRHLTHSLSRDVLTAAAPTQLMEIH